MIEQSATRFNNGDWFHTRIDTEEQSCVISGFLNGEPIEFSGGGGGGGAAYELLASETFNVSTTSTSTVSVGTVQIDPSKIEAGKMICVVIRDTVGPRTGYFLGSLSVTIVSNAGIDLTAIMKNTVRKQSNGVFSTHNNTAYTIYPDKINADGSIPIKARYDSSLTGTINSTYEVNVYKSDWPENGSIFGE